MFLKKQAVLLLATLSLGVVTITSAQAVNCDPGFLYNNCFWCDKTFSDVDDTDDIRQRLGIKNMVKKATVAAGRTNISSLSDKFYKGLSSGQKTNANDVYKWYWFMSDDYKVLLRSIEHRFGKDRAIKAPHGYSHLIKHAEEEILNQVYLDTQKLSPLSLLNKRLSLHISNRLGVCSACLSGVEGANIDSEYLGILQQFTTKRKNLTLCIKASDQDTGKAIHVTGTKKNPIYLLKIKNGRIIN